MESINQALAHQQGRMGEQLVALGRLVEAHDPQAIDGQQAMTLCVAQIRGLGPKELETSAIGAIAHLTRPERLELGQFLQERARRMDLNTNGLMKPGLQDPNDIGAVLAGLMGREPGTLFQVLGGELLTRPVVKLAVAALAVEAGAFRVRREKIKASP